ncbi:MAG: hypothetical protein AAF497_03505 [Planctomycetota bacterium]
MESTRIIKFGGSLLSRDHWADDFRHWYTATPGQRDILVVGGGSRVDRIRELDRRLKLGDVACHFLAVAQMDILARTVSKRLGWPLISSPGDCCKHPRSVAITGDWMDDAENRGTVDLSVSWDVTSDSIAAWVAKLCDAHQLVLLKSRRAVGENARDWTAARIVDPCFPRLSATLNAVTVEYLPPCCFDSA